VSDDLPTGVARRAAFTARIQAETGIDEAMIERLVRGFYARVEEDDILAPIFASRKWFGRCMMLFLSAVTVAEIEDGIAELRRAPATSRLDGSVAQCPAFRSARRASARSIRRLAASVDGERRGVRRVAKSHDQCPR